MIREAFRNELAESTKIVIAQRITSVMESDKIFVMNEGRVVGEGTHEQLMASCEDYMEIYASQMEGKNAYEKGGNE